MLPSKTASHDRQHDRLQAERRFVSDNARLKTRRVFNGFQLTPATEVTNDSVRNAELVITDSQHLRNKQI